VNTDDHFSSVQKMDPLHAVLCIRKKNVCRGQGLLVQG
jgi:hypothetical protein